MRIEITEESGVRHGTEFYEGGKEYDLPDHVAGYFLGTGWAKVPGAESPGFPPDPSEVNLDVHDVAATSDSTSPGEA